MVVIVSMTVVSTYGHPTAIEPNNDENETTEDHENHSDMSDLVKNKYEFVEPVTVEPIELDSSAWTEKDVESLENMSTQLISE